MCSVRGPRIFARFVGALALAALLAAGFAIQQTPAARSIADPIPEDPVMSRLGLVLEEVATFPKSEPVPAPTDRRLMRHARINQLGEIPDGSKRLYVPDL